MRANSFFKVSSVDREVPDQKREEIRKKREEKKIWTDSRV
jgi:hypothetical protein